MIRLPSVFASGALFQQNSALTFRGTADGAQVTVRLMRDECTVEEVTAAVENGRFTADLHTPAASLAEYSICLSDGEELLLEHVLFGELWLASGQSNMSFENLSMPKYEDYLSTLDNHPVRVYVQDYPEGVNQAQFPRHPSDALGGRWCTANQHDLMRHASAVGTAFLQELTHYFRDRIPVGILNASWGGTFMRSWLPEDAVRADPVLHAKFTDYGIYPEEDKWNQCGELNFQQAYCQYNCKIEPLLGVRIRGVIWYQGESDVGGEFERKLYHAYLCCYHDVYARRFAADPLNFMMISALLYPWIYGAGGETQMGYLNQAFVDTAIEEPHKFAFTPIADLSPIWSYHTDNHPIHPANKYDVGYRLALLAESNSYDRGSQRTPATFSSCEREGQRLLIRFRHASSGLHIDGNRLRGLYVAGKNQVYMAAESEIIAPDTLAVWHPALEEPLYAAYGYSSFEEGLNLFAGEFPVAPFATDREHFIRIECKPWLDLTRTAVWVNNSSDIRDCFYHPVWQPLPGSEVCTDPAFTETGMSLRISSDENTMGVFVKSYPYNRLDLQNYAALHMHLYNTKDLKAEMELCFEEGDPIVLPIEKTDDLGDGWSSYSVDFSALPEGEIRRMIFRFTHSDGPMKFVNMEALMLLPKV